jgi:hypothetical protein
MPVLVKNQLAFQFSGAFLIPDLGFIFIIIIFFNFYNRPVKGWFQKIEKNIKIVKFQCADSQTVHTSWFSKEFLDNRYQKFS